MFKLMTVLLIVIVLLAVSGCTYTVIENRSVPSATPWNGVPDQRVYNPKDISQRLDGNNASLELDVGNYSTSYRGLKIFGIEAQRDPDAEIGKEYFYLLLGVRRNAAQLDMAFSPWELVLEISDLTGTDSRYFQPKVVRQAVTEASCDYWNIEEQQTYPGEVVDAARPIPIARANNGEFNCFHFIFETRPGFDNLRMSLDLSRSLPSFKYKRIYFHPKKIDWTTSN